VSRSDLIASLDNALEHAADASKNALHDYSIAAVAHGEAQEVVSKASSELHRQAAVAQAAVTAADLSAAQDRVTAAGMVEALLGDAMRHAGKL
jgi:hypothetical protein